MNLSQLFPSNYLSKDDAARPFVAVIKAVSQEEVGSGEDREVKPVLSFQGDVKSMVLNRSNAETIAALYGDDTAAWAGKSVEIYVDPNVTYAGRRIGGVRIRAPQQQPQNVFAAQQTTANGFGNGAAPVRWDVSDGHNMMPGKTTDEVRAYLATVDATKFRIRPAGSNVPPKTCDVWLMEHAPQPAATFTGTNEIIPF